VAGVKDALLEAVDEAIAGLQRAREAQDATLAGGALARALQRLYDLLGDPLGRTFDAKGRFVGSLKARLEGLTPADAVQRALVEPHWFDASDLEVAEITGLNHETVRQHRAAFEQSARMRSMVAHAREVAKETGYAGRPSDLVTVALQEYAARRRVEAARASAVPWEDERAGQHAPNAGGAPRARGDGGREAAGLSKATGDGQTGIPGTR
jgi:hypothetical protein